MTMFDNAEEKLAALYLYCDDAITDLPPLHAWTSDHADRAELYIGIIELIAGPMLWTSCARLALAKHRLLRAIASDLAMQGMRLRTATRFLLAKRQPE